MKVVVTSTGDTLESGVDSRFGRCMTFVVVDTETLRYEAVHNDSVGSAHGAGVGAAQAVVRLDVEAVLTGHVGPNAHMALTKAGVKVYTRATGTVMDAVESFERGELNLAATPTVGGHFGRGGRGRGRRRA